MTIERVKAPLTYDPGKGRPKEHLAYLNKQEMAALRRMNGNNKEKGPRGLPSFPPDDAIGSSSRTTSSTNTKSTSTNTGTGMRGAGSNYGAGSAGPNTTRSGPSYSGGTGNKQNSTGTRGAGSNYGAGSAGPNTSRSGPSYGGGNKANTTSSPRGNTGSYPSRGSQNPDTAAKQAAAARDAVKIARESEPFKADIAKSGVRSINVGPMGTPVQLNGNINGAINRVANPVRANPTPPHAVKAQQDAFYANDPFTQASLARMRDNVALKNAFNETISPQEIAKGIGSISATGIVNGIGNAVQSGIQALYNDPVGIGKAALKSLYDSTAGMFGDYAFGDKPMFDANGYPMVSAAGDSLGIAANVGIGANIAAKGLGVAPEAGSVTSLIGSRTTNPDLLRANAAAEKVLGRRFASTAERLEAEQEAFEASKRAHGIEGVSGLQRLAPTSPNMGYEAYDNMGFRPGAIDRIESGHLTKNPANYSDIFSPSITQELVPDLPSAKIAQNLKDKDNLGGYYPGGKPAYTYDGVTGVVRSYRDDLFGRTPARGADIEVNTTNPDTFRKVTAHEAGHFTADPNRGGLFSGANPGVIRARLDTDPSTRHLSPREKDILADRLYRNYRGEVASNKVMNTLDTRTPEQITDWGTRFNTLYSEEEARAAFDADRRLRAMGAELE